MQRCVEQHVCEKLISDVVRKPSCAYEKNNFQGLVLLGVLMHWFKEIKIDKIENGSCPMYDFFSVVYIDGHSVTHSYGNRKKLNDLFMNECDVNIPIIYEYTIESKDYEFNLIEPSIMVKYCDKILANKNCDKCCLRDRVEWK